MTAFSATAFVVVVSACSSSSGSSSGGTSSSSSSGDLDIPQGDGSTSKKDITDAGPCLASNGTAPACTGSCATECTNAVALYKSDVATSIDTCLSGAVAAGASDEDCQAAAPSCVNSAEANSCTDDNADTFCQAFLAGCAAELDGGEATDVTQADCIGLVQGMTDDGRNTLQSCVTNGQTCTACVTNLRALTLTASH